ncbi:MAG: Hsp20/alpha crystallin family protein [Halobacteriaceae archaeon]
MDDSDDPFDDFFDEIERMMNDIWEADRPAATAGFGDDVHVDVHETPDEVRVVADIPGVAKEDLSLQCDGETLTVSAASDRREFDERLRLPARVDADSASATFNNGVLEVVFDRVESADIDLA